MVCPLNSLEGKTALRFFDVMTALSGSLVKKLQREATVANVLLSLVFKDEHSFKMLVFFSELK